MVFMASVMSLLILGSILERIFLERSDTNESLSEFIMFSAQPFSSKSWDGLIFSVSAILSITSGGGNEAPHSIPFM